jgi:hypothetical protein
MHSTERRLRNMMAGLAAAHGEAHREPDPTPAPTREELDAAFVAAFRRLIGADDDENRS